MSFFSRFFSRSAPEQRTPSPENPANDLGDAATWEDIFGGAESEAGVSVNLNTTATVSAIWRGVNLIANTVAKLPLSVVDENLLPIPSHFANRLINRRAAPHLSAFHFQQTMTAIAILKGNAYAWIRRVGGVPVELLPLDPDSTYPVRRDGVLWYVTTVAGQLRVMFPSETLHIHGLGFDGLVGRGIISLASDDIGTEVAHRKHDARYFQNPTPPFTLEAPETLSDVAYSRLKADFDKIKPGLKGAHRPAILEEGLKANPLTLKPSDLQAIEQKKFRLIAFANWLCLAPHKLGAEGKSAYASLEQENQATRDETFDPWLVTWEDELAYKLLSTDDFESGKRTIAYDRDSLDRVNSEAKAKFLQVALAGAPVMMLNEARRKIGLPPVPGGNKIVWPGNIAPTGNSEPKPGDSTGEPTKEPTDEE